MGKYDVLKQYKIQIGADTAEFLNELSKLEAEANKKLKNLNLSEGLRNDVTKLIQEIGDMKKTLVSATNEINTNINNISTNKLKNDFETMTDSVNGNIESLNKKMESFQNTLKTLQDGNFDNLTDGLNKSLGTLSEGISKMLAEFKDVSEIIRKIKMGTVDVDVISDSGVQSTKNKAKQITNDVDRLVASLTESVKELNKIKKRKTNNLSQILNLETTENFDSTLAQKQIRSLASTVIETVDKLSKIPSINLSSIFKGISYEEILDIDEILQENVDNLHKDVKKNIPKNIDADVRFRIKLDEDVEGTATVKSIVDKITGKDGIIDTVQKQINKKSIKIPIGYTADTSNVKGEKELEKIEGKDPEKTIFKLIKADIKADSNNLVSQVNSAIDDTNKKLKESGKKIEVEVIGKVNPDTIEDSANNIAYEVEDAQYKLKNNIGINGGNLSIDSSSGIATETTLSDIRSILSQWNTTGIPGTQSKEFKEQLKNKEANSVIASDFDKYFRKYLYKPTKRENDIHNTTDFLESTLNMRLDKKEALKVLKRNRNLKKGGEEGLAALKSSDYYNKSKIIDGVEYTQFETGTKLKDWQAKLETLYKESFNEAGKIVGGLFDISKEDKHKLLTEEQESLQKKRKETKNLTDLETARLEELNKEIENLSNVKTKNIKGYLQKQIDKVDRDNKSTRESLNLNKLQHKKDKYGKYTDEIVYEHGTVTSTEDAYVKTKNILDRIKADAEADYRIQEAKTRELIEQREIIQQIYDLEKKQKVSPLSQEDNELLTSLKQDLSSRTKEISDKNRYNELVDKQNKLQEKNIKEGLTSPERKELKEIETEIESLFKDVDDLSKYVVQQMATDAETGLSFIDQRIEESKKAAKDIIKTAQHNIGQVFNPIDENGNKTAKTIQVKSQAQYDYYEKEIEKARKRNGYLSGLIKQGKDGKTDYSAMTDAEKAEYFSNQKYIKALRARNLIYAEQNNLEAELIKNKDVIIDKEKATIKSLHVSDSEKRDYERVYAEMHNTDVSERLYLSSLSDKEFDKAIAAFERVNIAIDNQAKLSNEEVKALVQSRINEDIAYLKKSLEQEEAELIKMEKDPSRYSQKQKDNKQYRINRIINSIEQLENPEKESRSSAKILAEKRSDLNKNKKEQDAIVQKMKEELGITEDQVVLTKELFAINKDIASTKEEIRRKDNELNTSVIVPETTNKKGEITSSHADALKNSRTILSTELKELEHRKKEIESILSSSTNVDALKQFGLVDLSSEEKENINKQSVKYTKQAVEMLAQKTGLNKENIADLEKVLVLEAKIYKEEMRSKDYRDTFNDPLFDHPRKVKQKGKKSKFVEQIPKSEQDKFEKALIEIEKSDNIIKGFNKEKQEAIDNIIPTITTQIKEEIKDKIKSLQEKIDKGDISSGTKLKKDELESTLKSTTAIQDLVQQRINFIFESVDEVRKVIEAQMPKDGTQIDFGLLSKDGLTQLFDLLEKEEILSDEIYQILARVNGSGALSGKHFRANSGLGLANFDPFDTTYDPKNIYAERSALYEDQITHMGDASVDTARKYLELAKEIKAEREAEKQKAIEVHEAEKKIVAERQKELRLTKAYEDQYISPFGSTDEKNITDGSIGEARSKVNAISEEINSLNEELSNDKKTGLNNKIEEISKNSEREFLTLIDREKEIAQNQQNRLNEISNLQEELKKEKILQRKDGESDKDYQSRSLQFQEKQQRLKLSIEEKVASLKKKNTEELKKEKKEIKEIEKIRQSLISKYGDTTGLTSDGLLNNTDLAYSDFENKKNIYDAARSRLGDSDDEVIELGKELKKARDKFISEAAKYLASGDVDNIDRIRSQFEKQSQLKLDEQTANLRKQRDDISQEILNAEIRKKAAESEVNAQIKAREEAEKRLAINKEIKKFQTGMNIDQKKASLGVDLELIRIQELQEELSKTPVGTDQYKELERQIVEAKRELSLFRAEAETLGLAISQTTGRMFLKSDTGLTGLNYNGLPKKVDVSKIESNTATYTPTKEDIARQKEMSKEQVKSYHYHSDMVDSIKLEANEKKRLWKMSLIGNMTDKQAEVTLEIQKTVASVKNWNKATEEQKRNLKELHDKAKSLGLEIYDKGKSKNYVKQLVSTKDFKINPEQYATNKYLKQMLSSPTGSYKSSYDPGDITNVRLATESTLQNIQKILMTGVKVKLMDKKQYPNYKGKLNKLPDVNGDNTPYGYLLEQQNKKERKSFVYDATKMHNYSKMSTSQQDIAKKFAEVKNKISQEYSKELGSELHSIIEEAKKAGLSYSKNKKNLYLADKNVGKNADNVKKETKTIKDNTKATKENNKVKREYGVFGEGTKDINSDLKNARNQLSRKGISSDIRNKWEDIQKAAIAEAEKRGYKKNDRGFYVDEKTENQSTSNIGKVKEKTNAIQEQTKAYREWSDAVKYGTDRMQKAKDLHDAGLLNYSDDGTNTTINRTKLVANQAVTQDALGKGGTWSDFNAASNKYVESVLQKLGLTSKEFKAQLKAIDTIETTDYWKNISSGGWIRYGTSNESSVEKTTKELNYKIYAAFENAVNLTKENIADILNRLQKEGFVGQLKTNPSVDTIGETDQIVIHGRNEIDQKIAYNVLKAYANDTGKHFSFLDGGFDRRKPESKSFSTLLGSGLINIDDYKNFTKDSTTTLPSNLKDLISQYQLLLELNNKIHSEGGKAFEQYGLKVAMALEGIENKITDCGYVFTQLNGVNGISNVDDILNGNMDKIIPVEKFKKGMLKDKPELEKTVAELAKIPEETVREILSISSPSKVMEQLGYWTVNGFAKGVKDNSDDIKNAIIKAFTDAKISQSDLSNWLGLDETKSLIGKQGNNAVYKAIKDISSNNLLPKSYKEKAVKKNAWEFDINASSISTLLSKAKQGDSAIKRNAKGAEEWKKVLPQILDRIKQIREENLNVLNITEQIVDSEKQAVETLARRINMQGTLNISKNRRINNETGEEKISYSVKDGSGNTAIFDKDGDRLILRKSKDVVTTINKLMSEVSNTLNNNTVKEINSYMTQLLPDGEKEKVLELREAYKSLNKILESFDEGNTNFSKEEIESIYMLIEKINSVKSSFTGEAIDLGQINISNANELQNTLRKLAQETENVSIHNARFSKSNREMTYQIIDADNMLNTYRITVDKTGNAVKELVKSEERLNTFQKLVSATSKKFGEIFNYMVASTSIYEIFNFFRRGITVVQEFDKAMTELYKVSNDSTEALNRFGKESYNVAKQIGSTGAEIINSAADWTKLGYAIDEASELAKNSALYANVGDMDIDTATEHMVSTLKAFNVEAKDSISIVDKFNEIGNNYAISSSGIGEALERSASSLVAAGNDIDQAIALITAGNVVSQDPESVGNAVKVLSLRIRGSKTELEEMGEETDNLSSSSSKLREELKALTGVDIMLDDNTYKDTYTILLEISKVWDQLSDVSQANVLEKLAGKTRASVVAGLLQQGETLENVYNDSKNAAGSASKENEKYLNSIQGHLDLLTNQWQSIWTSEITRDVVNWFIDIGTAALKLVDNIGLVKTAIAGITGILVAKNLSNIENGGGRVKKLTLVIKYATESFNREVCEF